MMKNNKHYRRTGQLCLSMGLLCLLLFSGCKEPTDQTPRGGSRIEFENGNICLVQPRKDKICLPLNGQILALRREAEGFQLQKLGIASPGNRKGLGKYPHWTAGKQKDLSIVLHHAEAQITIANQSIQGKKELPFGTWKSILLDGYAPGRVRAVSEICETSLDVNDAEISGRVDGHPLLDPNTQFMILSRRCDKSQWEGCFRYETSSSEPGIGTMVILEEIIGNPDLRHLLPDENKQYDDILHSFASPTPTTGPGPSHPQAQPNVKKSQGFPTCTVDLEINPPFGSGAEHQWTELCCVPVGPARLAFDCDGNLLVYENDQVLYTFSECYCPVGFALIDSDGDDIHDCLKVYWNSTDCSNSQMPAPCPSN